MLGSPWSATRWLLRRQAPYVNEARAIMVTNPYLTSKRDLSYSTRQNSCAPGPIVSPHSSLSFEKFGQPVHASHPHLLDPGELTPGIKASEYAERRKTLMDMLPSGSIVFCSSAAIKYMSGQIFYKFRQSSNFWYLTGIEEQEAAILLIKTHEGKGHQMWLFVQERDAYDELWHGPRTGVEQSGRIFGADEACNINLLSKALATLLEDSATKHLYADVPEHLHSPNPSKRARKSLLSYIHQPSPSGHDSLIKNAFEKRKPLSLSDEVMKMRKIKSPAERVVMRKAADLSGTAHAKTMRFGNQASTEAQLAAHFEYICAIQGAQRPAYVPVVAGGCNALAIHYTNNNCALKEGELLLMDAGGYASDITRTFPVGPSGQFTAPQRELYAAILEVQKQLITYCAEDAHESLNSLHNRSVELLTAALSRIGFDLGARNRFMDKLYPHYLSHPIGIDLHEGNAERHQFLLEGQVITVEPGIYVPPDPTFPKWFHNIGIRIEDEVLIERSAPVVLSVNAPKEIVDVEATCQGTLGVGPY